MKWAKTNRKLICCINMDEMYIKEDVHFNGKHLQGYINFGQGIGDSDSLPLAK